MSTEFVEKLLHHHRQGRARHQFSNGHFGGWNPQRPDFRDRYYEPPAELVASTPPTFELPGIAAIPVLNQLKQGSCTGHGGAGVLMFDMTVQGAPIVIPAREMIYYDARIPEGTTDQDAGASIRDMVAGLAKYGACTDAEFPYNDAVFNVAPSQENYTEGQGDKALVYEAVHQPHLNATIASGRPIVYGMTCYMSMMSQQVAETGIIPIPGPGDTVDGGHCTWLFGFNATDTEWTSPSGLIYPPHCKAGRNSWGEDWGAGGNYFLPQWFFDNQQCSDYWIVRSTSDTPAPAVS